MNKRYSDAQLLWLKTQGYSRVWKNRKAFLDTFNKTFNLNIGVYQFNNLVDYYKIKICTRQTESLFTDEQKQWLIENARSGKFKNCKHLTDTYNALFKECRKSDNIYSNLHTWEVSLNTSTGYTEEMDIWLKKNYLSYEVVDDAVAKFNAVFNTSKTNYAISSHARKLGLRRKNTQFCKGQSKNAKSVGSISYRSDFAWIKINTNNNKTSWIPLHKYVWEQAYGKIPDGYCVVFASDDRTDVSLKNLALIDRRGTAIMSKLGWWTDNKVITKDGVQWCNLYFVAKDNGVVL